MQIDLHEFYRACGHASIVTSMVKTLYDDKHNSLNIICYSMNVSVMMMTIVIVIIIIIIFIIFRKFGLQKSHNNH